MLKDLKDVSSGSTLVYDVCIIGTGPAGISVAKQLLDTGRRVVMLESGGEFSESKYQQLNKGENSGPRFLSLDASRMRCFGGSGKLWAGVCSPFKSDEFDKNPFVPLSGWPISLADLNKYYKQAAKMLGVSYEKFYSKSYFQDTFAGLSFKEFNRKNSFLSGRVYQTSSAKNRDFGEKYKKVFELSKTINVLFHSTVTELNLNKTNSGIQSVSVSDLDGNKALIEANVFVLACGALENPRLLLASNKFYKTGIGNSSGFVGSCFMSHPGIANVAEIYKTSAGRCIESGSYKDSYVAQFGLDRKERLKQKVLSCGLSISNYTDLSNFSTIYSGKILSDFSKLLKNFSFSAIYDKRTCRDKGKYASKVLDLGISLEQPPLHENRLSLLDKKDPLGVPLINMHWSNLSKIEKETVVKSAKTLAKELGALGIGRVRLTDDLLSGKSYEFNDPVNHHIGTTRMSETKENGVVDKNCKVFGMSNLYISGSSVFPTSSIVNPTYTIIALSLRLGDYLKQSLSIESNLKEQG